jgi:hypothetical protein
MLGDPFPELDAILCIVRRPSSAKLLAHEQSQMDRARYHIMLMLVDARRRKATSCPGPAFGAGF